MPELTNEKIPPHFEPPGERAPVGPYAELQVTSNFSFLRGGSHPQELVAQAHHMGCRAIAVTDINTLAGIVRGHQEACERQMPYIVGCRIQMKEEPLSLLVYPTDRPAYARLSRMLTLGKRRTEKGECALFLQDVLEHAEGNLAIIVPPLMIEGAFIGKLRTLRDAFDCDRLSLAASCLYNGQDQARLAELAGISRTSAIPLVATNDVHYHVPERRPLQDVLTCIRKGCTIEQAGFELFANAERHIKGPDEMQRLFRDHPRAIYRTLQIAERASTFSLEQLKYNYPSEICPPGKSMMQHLIDRTWEGARSRYPDGIPEDVQRRLHHEFQLIEELNYPAYFLTVDDIVAFARSQNILCQGRGAAANSAVCYCLGVTAVDPARIDLLVERFMSKERDEPPDIDIDFEHERREEVIQYLYGKYGRDRAALTAEVICYRRRSAIREVGKALGLSLDCVDRLAKDGDWWDDGVMNAERLRAHGLDPHDPTIHKAVHLAGELIGFPRHLSQHVGGFVLSECPLCEIVPIENASMPDRTIIEWDKDDIDHMGMMKVDILGLGMLTAVRKAIDLVNQWDRENGGEGSLQFHTIPAEDPAVYDMLCKADSVGVFQVESRAQMTMLPRLKPRRYYDLVVEVAIVRPGPIQGGMVHPYLRRRNAEEPIEYPDDKIKAVLERTLGVPIFQEQAMRLVMVAAGFSAGDADQLRRAMAAWKKKGDVLEKFGRRIVAGMLKNGYTQAYADRVVGQIRGFGEYGFPESHAASFALIVYVSAWLKCHHPACFTAALINSQPMGFYPPAQLVRDATNHGVAVRPIDVNFSAWDCTLERSTAMTFAPAIRLGMRLVSGLRQVEADQIAAVVGNHGKFRSIMALWRASNVRVETLRQLAHADAFRSMGLDRQAALWEIRHLRDVAMPMFDSLENLEQAEASPASGLPPIAPYQMVVHDYAAVGLSLKAHPISFVRKQLDRLLVTPNSHLADETRCPHKQQLSVAGLVLVRQRPGTARGIIFMTIEDETGMANLVIRPEIYERFRRELRHSASVIVTGKVERLGQVVHVMVEDAENLAEKIRAKKRKEPPTRPRNFH
ncbi:MAG TPA: error-prone DNA polymerase [Phycisphaerae bacterium]|nr:error-prone DNA polymerase [Phycisphaerae bacterium]